MLSIFNSRNFAFILLSLVTTLSACEARRPLPPVYSARTPTPTPTASATVPMMPGATSPRSNSNSSSDASSTTSCGTGREAATPELRECCRQQRWGDACNGSCWDAGASEKLRRVCVAGQSPTEPVKDCGQSPSRENTQAWCDFHFNRRYCGISDADWLKACRPPTP